MSKRKSAAAIANDRKRGRKKSRKGHGWCGLLKAAVRADLEERGDPPELTDEQVLEWADAFHTRTGKWPTTDTGPVPEAAGETWLLIEAAFFFGLRGFGRGRTLARFFAEHRGRYNQADRHFSIAQILVWADAHHLRTGDWPLAHSGPVEGGGGVSWVALDYALRYGGGGFPGGSSLAKLLEDKRGVPMWIKHTSPLTEQEILAWADRYFDRRGKWPTIKAGAIPEEPGTTWNSVSACLDCGGRGLPGGSSLPGFLKQHRGVRYAKGSDRLTIDGILGWLDAHYERTGQWPVALSGPVLDAPGETWINIEAALLYGYCGLPGGSSIARLLAEKRGRRNPMAPPDLTIPQILAWADGYHARTGSWPTRESGPIPEAPGETWKIIGRAFQYGLRGLPSGSSMLRELVKHRGVEARIDPPPFSIPQIVTWARAHEVRTGRWPTRRSGAIAEAPGETWRMVTRSLEKGWRGLQKGVSLAGLRDKSEFFTAKNAKKPGIDRSNTVRLDGPR
jgi:hypothetical protein